jgi:hypothetical protein
VERVAGNARLCQQRHEDGSFVLDEDGRRQVEAKVRGELRDVQAAMAALEQYRAAVKTLQEQGTIAAGEVERCDGDSTPLLRFIESMNLAYLPEAREVLLRARVRAMEGLPAGEWSVAKPPKEWARDFGVSPAQIVDLFKRQAIRNKKLSSKLYRVATCELPPKDDKQDKPRGAKK